ncbi:MAG: hypothetical protein VKL39_16475 [Leptolyngbyaceae bacterium]|nr:hypothetical protein [Leptolyngbyaceae bacterium]
MHDNKVRLSQDVIEKAEVIASEWGLKNARAAVEAVFRKYSDEYLHGRLTPTNVVATQAIALPPTKQSAGNSQSTCEAMDVLEDLLAM